MTSFCKPASTNVLVNFHPSKMTATLRQTLEELSLEDATQSTDFDGSLYSECHFAHLKSIDQPSTTKSILKRARSSPTSFVCTKKSSYRALPVPDLNEIAKQAAATQESEDNTDRLARSVSFDEIQMRMYSQTVGDHPETSYGPPIALDWGYEEVDPVKVDTYEATRAKRRPLRHLVLSYHVRKHTLVWVYGHSEDELEEAARLRGRTQFRRGVTRCFLPCSKVEEAIQSAGRKAKRVVIRSKTLASKYTRESPEKLACY